MKTMVLLVVLSLTACATVQPVNNRVASSTSHKVERNYTLGVAAEAYVGQPVVRAKDYWVRNSTRAAVKPSEDFTLKMPMFGPTMHFQEGQPIQVVGTTERDGRRFRVVELPGAEFLRFLVNDDGSFDGRAINIGGARMGYTYRFEPASVRLLSGTEQSVDVERGFTNFEIVYSGATKDQINLLYREYTPEDLARPAFTQALAYPRDSQSLRFREVKIRLLDANSESIRYVVEQDGLEPQ